jgi:N-acetyl-anhydromuramyl-L-alanine amidase AmpD
MEGHLTGAIATWNQGKADAHLSVLEDGTIVLTCLLEHIAWHAGTNNKPNGGAYGRTAFWRTNNVNPHSIGVELEGFYTQPYTAAQAAAVRKIARWAEKKYGIPRVHTFDQIAGQHTHSELSSSRLDPGPLFDWTWVTG